MPPERAKLLSGQGDPINDPSAHHQEQTHFDSYLEYETLRDEQLTKINDARSRLKEERNRLNRQKRRFDAALERMDAIDNLALNNRNTIETLDAISRNPPLHMTVYQHDQMQRELEHRQAKDLRHQLHTPKDHQIRQKVEHDVTEFTTLEHDLILRERRLEAENQAFYEKFFLNYKPQGQNEREYPSSRPPRKSGAFRRALDQLFKNRSKEF